MPLAGWLGRVGPTIAVLGCCGGVGASTFAAVLAWVAGGVLVDLDPVAGGVDVLLGIEQVPGARWSGLRLGGGHLDPELLATGLPRWRGVRVLAADTGPAEEAVGAVCGAASELAPVTLDAPRLPCPLREAALVAADVVLVFGRCTVPALAGLRALLADLDRPGVGLVLRRGEVPLADARAELAAPVLAAVPATCGRRPLGASGRRPRRCLARAAAGILDGLGS